MHDILRIGLYLVCFLAAAYALSGVDFARLTRRGSEIKMQLLYILLAIGLGYIVAQFLLGLSMDYFI